jgi:AraC-like DNA-binding protein
LPEPGLVLGLRYRGWASELDPSGHRLLPANTVAGMRTAARRMRTSADGGTVIVKFRELGAATFLGTSLHVLGGRTLPLTDVTPTPAALGELSGRLARAADDEARVSLVQRFLAAHPRHRWHDRVVLDAVEVLRSEDGVRVAELARRLRISQDALEKRFRSLVGLPPKQFASLLRLREAVKAASEGASLSRSSHDAGFADQSHFTRAFRAMAGDAPQRLLRSGELC